MKHILLIEDNIEMSENTAEILELSNYKVSTAFNGKEGVQKAITLTPDLILCDIMMPEMDGFGVAFALKRNEETKQIPLIFLTAKADKTDLRKGMELGADDYLTKPFTSLELLNAIETRLLKSENNSSKSNIIHSAEQDYNKLLKIHFDKCTYPKKFINRKELIYTEGSMPYYIYVIQNGLVKTSKSLTAQKEIIIEMEGKDSILGASEAILDIPYQNFCVALEPTSVIQMPKEEFLKLIESNDGALKSVYREQRIKQEKLELQLYKNAYQSVRKRLSSQLVDLQNLYIQNTNQEYITLSREDLGALIGVAQETVTRTLSEFKENAWIDIKAGKIKVLRADALLKLRH